MGYFSQRLVVFVYVSVHCTCNVQPLRTVSKEELLAATKCHHTIQVNHAQFLFVGKRVCHNHGNILAQFTKAQVYILYAYTQNNDSKQYQTRTRTAPHVTQPTCNRRCPFLMAPAIALAPLFRTRQSPKLRTLRFCRLGRTSASAIEPSSVIVLSFRSIV